MCKEILICSSLSEENRNGSGTLKGDWKPSLSSRWGKFQVVASYFHLNVWSILCGPLPANCSPSGDALCSVPQTHFCLHFIWLASLRRWERMHLKLTLAHCTQFTLLLLFSILTGLFANKGQKALTAHKENVCVLLRAIWLGHKPLSRGGGMEDWW